MTFITNVITLEVIPSAKFKFMDNEESLLSRITVISVCVHKYHYVKLRGEVLILQPILNYSYDQIERGCHKGYNITLGGAEICIQNF
jgi:hypothetical protein